MRSVGGIPVSCENGIPHLDLRGLEPPRPAVVVLTFLDDADCGDAVVVRLERDPIFLYPELAERGWAWEPLQVTPGDVVLRLSRGGRDGSP